MFHNICNIVSDSDLSPSNKEKLPVCYYAALKVGLRHRDDGVRGQPHSLSPSRFGLEILHQILMCFRTGYYNNCTGPRVDPRLSPRLLWVASSESCVTQRRRGRPMVVWFSEYLWHYINITLDFDHYLRYTWCTGRFRIWLCFLHQTKVIIWILFCWVNQVEILSKYLYLMKETKQLPTRGAAQEYLWQWAVQFVML
jgi:hypothetical protein